MSRLVIIVPIPDSTPDKVVFSIDHNDRFDTSAYNPGITHGRATTEEITQVTSELESALQPFISKVGKLKCSLIVWFLLIFAVIGFFGFTFVGAMNPVGMFGIMIGGFILMIGGRFFYRSKVDQLASDCKAVSQKIIEGHNASLASRGLRWVMPSYYPLWVELHKDYLWAQNNNNGGQQPIYMPPNMYQQPQPQDQPQPQYQA